VSERDCYGNANKLIREGLRFMTELNGRSGLSPRFNKKNNAMPKMSASNDCHPGARGLTVIALPQCRRQCARAQALATIDRHPDQHTVALALLVARCWSAGRIDRHRPQTNAKRRTN